jgi:peptidoglycan hydrolase-like protein with peptidoglycan-binding domain
MTSETKYWALANKAAKETGWFPETIYTQWAWETAHFTSNNLIKNNNIAGQTWYKGCGYPKGTSRPQNEGGYYIKYPDAAKGYVDFIKKNHRYDDVKLGKTVEEQIDRIFANGWAADPHYAVGLKSVHRVNQKKGVYKLPKTDAPPYPGHPLKKGTTNTTATKQLQKKLGIKTDGVFGTLTKEAVISYQKEHGLVPDGSVGERTWGAMF